jgi:hypothetical protein
MTINFFVPLAKTVDDNQPFFVSCENFPSCPWRKPLIVYLCSIVTYKHLYEDISGKHVPSEDERSGARQLRDRLCIGIMP